MGRIGVTLRTAADRKGAPRGQRTFYLSSLSRPGHEDERCTFYVLTYVRRAGARRFACSCPDYRHQRWARVRHCKHIRLLRGVIATMGGVSKVPKGVTVTV